MKRRIMYIVIPTCHTLNLIACIFLLLEKYLWKKRGRNTLSKSDKLSIKYLRRCLVYTCGKDITQYKKILHYLDRRNEPYIRIVCVVQLPPRLNVNVHTQQQDGETVFPGLLRANLTREGLRVDVPADLQHPNNQYTAIRVRVQHPVENNTETGLGTSGGAGDRDGADNLNGADNRDATGWRRGTGNTNDTDNREATGGRRGTGYTNDTDHREATGGRRGTGCTNDTDNREATGGRIGTGYTNDTDTREATGWRRGTGYGNSMEILKGDEACSASQLAGIVGEGRRRRMISVEVRYRGSYILFQVRKCTPVSEFIRSRDFLRKVTAKWNIPEYRLRNMVLRHHDQIIETLEIDCSLRLTTGHLDLFIEQHQRTND